MYNEVIFDLETQKFFDEIEGFDPANLGASVVSVYQRILDKNFKEEEGRMTSFWVDDLSGLWEVFSKADRIIGFNSIRFDLAVLRPYSPIDLTKLNHFDILDCVRQVNGRRVSLNSIAQETLGEMKVDDPRNAIIYFQKKDKESLKKLKYYCEQDVVLTRDIYDYGLNYKKLKFKDYWNTVREIKVDFSYPKIETPNEEQVSLF